MPSKFLACIRKPKSRIRTIKPKGKKSRTYIRVCFDPTTKKSYSGEIQLRKHEK